MIDWIYAWYCINIGSYSDVSQLELAAILIFVKEREK